MSDSRRIEDLNLKNPHHLKRLGKFNIRPSILPSDPLVSEIVGKDVFPTAFSIKEEDEVYMPGGKPLFFPEFPQDFNHHPNSYRSLNVWVYVPANNSVGVRQVRIKQLFFMVPVDYVLKMVNGEATEDHLMEILEKASS